MRRNLLGWVIVAVAVAAVFVFQTIRSAEGRPSSTGECAQWEVAFAPLQMTVTTARPQEAGKPVIDKAPPGGWEPFAYAPSGQLAYRRCSP